MSIAIYLFYTYTFTNALNRFVFSKLVKMQI